MASPFHVITPSQKKVGPVRDFVPVWRQQHCLDNCPLSRGPVVGLHYQKGVLSQGGGQGSHEWGDCLLLPYDIQCFLSLCSQMCLKHFCRIFILWTSISMHSYPGTVKPSVFCVVQVYISAACKMEQSRFTCDIRWSDCQKETLLLQVHTYLSYRYQSSFLFHVGGGADNLFLVSLFCFHFWFEHH